MSRIITPPAKFCAVPLRAIPMASVAAEKTAMSDVTLTPSVETTISTSSSVKITRTVLRMNDRSEISTRRCSSARSSSLTMRRRIQRPTKWIASARRIFSSIQTDSERRFCNTVSKSRFAILWTVSAKWAFCTLSGSISGAGVSVPKKRGHINRE